MFGWMMTVLHNGDASRAQQGHVRVRSVKSAREGKARKSACLRSDGVFFVEYPRTFGSLATALQTDKQ